MKLEEEEKMVHESLWFERKYKWTKKLPRPARQHHHPKSPPFWSAHPSAAAGLTDEMPAKLHKSTPAGDPPKPPRLQSDGG